MTTTFLEDPDDIIWLSQVHGIPTDGVVCALLYGNEDCPDKVQTFTENNVACVPLTYVATMSGDLVPQSDWVEFGEVAVGLLKEQSQYASRYIDGRYDRPNCGEGLRFRGLGGKPLDTADYHDIEIHRDDIGVFVIRVKNAQNRFLLG